MERTYKNLTIRNATVDDAAITTLKTVGDVVKYIESKQQ